MSVDTKTAEGRRELHFGSLEDLEAEIERLSETEVKMLGNWSLAQIFTHLAAGLNSTIDGSSFKAPLFMRMMGPLMKKKFIQGGIPPGFKIPKKAEAQFLPSSDVELANAKAALQAAIQRVKSDNRFAPHPLFGKLSKDDTVQFQLRHAEMHLSFAVPTE